ncbi:hypothetical protein M406DRAFT_339414 [Cryphonectria parasitica EP155]|uniref:Uncharacterized protein n=1 Tax=Cryphonectria parasitica (strain ATCC 38755 / EP155) TaxID=660469 RepID=A0A9P4Y371_CRYP1|nr:uncharacterized protein M406DRAFT_339414 [Cryphonectria parasitica EP155]KAF3766132.1 hypothetical protein M406DRAFT_339414 [Cryphonectria parasitica EP155]
MDLSQTTARLRRTFQYPTDDSSNSVSPEALDEEEQESLIQSLADQNASANQLYRSLLLALPILSSIPYIASLFQPLTTLPALLGLTSLASTSFLLYNLPVTETGIPLLDAWAQSGKRPRARSDGTHDEDDHDDGQTASSSAGPSGLGALNRVRQQRRTHSLSYAGPRSPLEKFLPLLNIGLCVILVLSGLLASRNRAGESDGQGGDEYRRTLYGRLGLANIPAIVYAAVLVAKVVMAGVDPERELGALKYAYKGA